VVGRKRGSLHGIIRNIKECAGCVFGVSEAEIFEIIDRWGAAALAMHFPA
jgi:hypothetical protein